MAAKPKTAGKSSKPKKADKPKTTPKLKLKPKPSTSSTGGEWYPQYCETPIKVDIEYDGSGRVTILGDEARSIIYDMLTHVPNNMNDRLKFVVRPRGNAVELWEGPNVPPNSPSSSQGSDSCCPC